MPRTPKPKSPVAIVLLHDDKGNILNMGLFSSEQKAQDYIALVSSTKVNNLPLIPQGFKYEIQELEIDKPSYGTVDLYQLIQQAQGV
jgi:hypothetical protein